MLTTHGITPSMSRIGNSWDNACVESFFGTLKRNSCTIDTMPHEPKTRRTSFEYIEVSMIGTRHSALGYHSPVEYGSRAAVA
jgi:transposase InsO family protein